jgi:hypothetical protein
MMIHKAEYTAAALNISATVISVSIPFNRVNNPSMALSSFQETYHATAPLLNGPHRRCSTPPLD